MSIRNSSDEGPSGQVKGNGDPHCQSVRPNQAYRTLKVSQADSTEESKLIGLLREFYDKGTTVTMSLCSLEEEQTNKVRKLATRSAHEMHADDGIWTVNTQSPIMKNLRPGRGLQGYIRIRCAVT